MTPLPAQGKLFNTPLWTGRIGELSQQAALPYAEVWMLWSAGECQGGVEGGTLLWSPSPHEISFYSIADMV